MRTALLVAFLVVALAPAMPGTAASAYPLTLLEDPANDATQPPGAPSNQSVITSLVDVRRLSLDADTEEALAFTLTVEDLVSRRGDGIGGVFLQTRYDVNFTIEGIATPYHVRINATAFINAFVAHGAPNVFNAATDICNVSCSHATWTSVDDAADALHFTIPKWMLRRTLTTSHYPPFPEGVQAGSTLGGFHVEASIDHVAQPGTPGVTAPQVLDGIAWAKYVKDEVPTGTKTHSLDSMPSNGDPDLLVQVQRGTGWVPVAPGRTQTVTFALANLGPERRVVDLTYSTSPIFRWDNTGPSAYHATGPASVALPAGKWRNYTLTIEGPGAEATVPAESLLAIEAKAADGAHNADYAYIQPGVELGPGRSKFYLNDWTYEPDSDPIQVAFHTVSPPFNGEPFLTDRADEPGTAAPTWYDLRSITTRLQARALRGLAAPVALDPQGAAQLVLHVKAHPLPITSMGIQAQVYAGNTPIASLATTRDLTTDDQELRLSLPVTYTDTILEPRTTFGLVVVFEMTDTAQAQLLGTLRETILVQTRTTTATLPLIEVPEEYREHPSPSPFQVSLSGDHEEFVNPGRSRLFSFTIANVDAAEQRLRVLVNSTRPDWKLDVLPGSTYFVPAGEAVTVGVLVTVPPTAQDNDAAIMSLQAAADDGTVRIQSVKLTVVAGTDLADDHDKFRPDAADVARLAPTSADTPAPGAALAGLALVGVACWRGKRRREG